MTPATQQQVDYLLRHLHTKPKGMSTWDITQRLQKKFGNTARGSHYLIWLARNVYGSDVIITQYDWMRGKHVFRLPKDLLEVKDYARVRTHLVYRHMVNIVRLIDRGVVQFPAEDATAILEVRARLIGAMSLVAPVVVPVP